MDGFRVRVAEGEIGTDIDGLFVAVLEVDQGQFQSSGQFAATELYRHRFALEAVLEHGAVGQTELVLQGDPAVAGDFHGSVCSLLRSSRPLPISSTAPRVMKLSARLKAGQG